jgi:Zn-dependent protease with chaperone function
MEKQMSSNAVTFDKNFVAPHGSRANDFPLYNAQAAASDVFHTHLFPCYSPEYIQSQDGLKGKMLWCYGKAYEGASLLNRGLQTVVSPVKYVASGILSAGSYALSGVMNAVYPINPINGHRHFVGIPRSIEKVLGDWVFYPLVTLGMTETNELLPGTHQRIAEKVNEVIGRLATANAKLLNPEDEKTQFHYRAKTVLSSQMNAFAVPAGGMVVFTQLVKEIDGAIKSRKIKDATIQFEDGSKATVDVSNVTLEDTVAALMGHEMTHVASRHSTVAIMGGIIRSIVLDIGRFVLVAYLKSSDREYQTLTQKSESQLEEHERAALASKERLYSKLTDILSWVGEQVDKFSGLFHSRKNEYEADVTGTYFTNQANYNPLGAIYLQEILNQNSGGFSDLLHKHLEFMFTHPYGENRKRAIFAAINEINPQTLKDRTTWNLADNRCYDLTRCSPALKYAHDQSKK